MFFLLKKHLSKLSEFHYLEPGPYHSIKDIVGAINTFFQEKHKHREIVITVKVSRRTQKIEIYLANERSGLAFFGLDVGHFFGSNVGNEFGIMLGGKTPHQSELAYDIVRIHCLMIFTNLIEHNIVGDTKAPLLRCFPFISKLKTGDIITTGQYINYHTFSNLQLRSLLKNFFQIIHIDLTDTIGEKIPFVFVGITRLVLMLRKAFNFQF